MSTVPVLSLKGFEDIDIYTKLSGLLTSKFYMTSVSVTNIISPSAWAQLCKFFKTVWLINRVFQWQVFVWKIKFPRCIDQRNFTEFSRGNCHRKKKAKYFSQWAKETFQNKIKIANKKLGMTKLFYLYYLQHERRVVSGYTNSSQRRVYLVQHRREYCKWLVKLSSFIDLYYRSYSENTSYIRRENQSSSLWK